MKEITISRGKIEILAGIIILILGLSVFFVPVKSKTSLTYDGGNLVYTGYVANHRMNGYGTLTYSNGDTYDGDFVNGVFEGKGKFTAKLGWTYEGGFHKGKPHGQGILTAKNGKVYKGKFKQGVYQK